MNRIMKNRKFIAILLCIAMMFTIMPMSYADDSTGDGGSTSASESSPASGEGSGGEAGGTEGGGTEGGDGSNSDSASDSADNSGNNDADADNAENSDNNNADADNAENSDNNNADADNAENSDDNNADVDNKDKDNTDENKDKDEVVGPKIVGEYSEDANTAVKVSAPENAFPEGTILEIEPVYDMTDIGSTIPDEAALPIVAYDIRFMYEGEELQPANGLTVNVEFVVNNDIIPEDVVELQVYHIDENQDATIVDTPVVVDISETETGIAVVAETFSM